MKHLQLFESFNSTKYDKYFNLAVRDLSELKRFPLQYFAALVGTIKNKAGEAALEEIPEELVQACKDAIIEVYFSNIEPEWETDDQYEFWEQLGPDSFLLKHDPNAGKPGHFWGGSPYHDKSIPYIEWRPEIKAKCPSINFA